MVFFNKGAGGPDTVGGLFPWTLVVSARNRSGGTHIKGEVAQFAFSAGSQVATEIATNDSNSYLPGQSNDTIWNTVIDPQSNAAATTPRAGIKTGAFFGVCLDNEVLDDKIGSYGVFGIFTAFVADTSGGDGAIPGQPLTVNITNSFGCDVSNNDIMVGFYIDAADASLGTRELKRVFLTQGVGLTLNGTGAAIT